MTEISNRQRPLDPRFSSGPCKPPTWKISSLSNAPLGRSHRVGAAKKKIESAIEQTREVLNIE